MTIAGVPGRMWRYALVQAITTAGNILWFVHAHQMISLIAGSVCAACLVFVVVLIIRWPAT